MRYELKTINFWSLVRVAFFLNIGLGFIIGLIYGFFFGLILAVLPDVPSYNYGYNPSEYSPVVFAFFMAVGGAFSGGFFGTLFWMLLGVMYNLTARVLGGFEFELQPAGGIQNQPALTPTAHSDGGATRFPPPPPQMSGRPPAPRPHGEDRPAASESGGYQSSSPPQPIPAPPPLPADADPPENGRRPEGDNNESKHF